VKPLGRFDSTQYWEESRAREADGSDLRRHPGPSSSCGGVGPSSPGTGHVPDQSRVVRGPYGGRVARGDDSGLLQEWAVARRRSVPEARCLHLVDVEGRDKDNAWTVADHCVLRLLRVAANVVRRHISMRPLRLLAAGALLFAGRQRRGSSRCPLRPSRPLLAAPLAAWSAGA
jgi:hypothetical protein